MNFVKSNPELQKNVWLELSTQRLIMMPVIIFAVLFLVSISSNEPESVMSQVTFTGASIILMIWGAKVAYDNIIAEYNERTWDWQRMSAIEPRQILVGKLLGATVYNWYGGLICLALWCALAVMNGHGIISTSVLVLKTLFTTVTVIAVAMMIAILRIRKGHGRDKIRSTPVLILIIIGAYFLMHAALQSVFKIQNDQENFSFHQLFSSVFYAAWAVIGLHQALRAELNYRNKSGWWYGFLLTSSVYQGLTFDDAIEQGYVLTAIFGALAVHALFFSYVLLIFEPKELTELSILREKIQRRNWTHLNYNAPLWLLTLPLIFISVIATWAVTDFPVIDDSSTNYDFWRNIKVHNIGKMDTLAMALSVCAFALRDFILMMVLSFSGRNKRIEAAFVLYLFLLYFVAPLITVKVDALRPIFIPSLEGGSVMAVLAPVIEATLLWFLLKSLPNWTRTIGVEISELKAESGTNS